MYITKPIQYLIIKNDLDHITYFITLHEAN